MSSLRNAAKAQQRPYKERHQPGSRAEFGLLEKKKDYKLRAKDYNDKKATLKKLKKKALNKNPDEFYFHMINSRTEGGVHKEKNAEETLTPEQIKLMQTQDLRYIVHKRTIEQKKIERLRASLHLIDSPSSFEDRPSSHTKNTHTFFVDDEKEVASFDLAKHLDTHPSLLGRTSNRPKMSDIGKHSKMLKLLKTDEETLANIRKSQHKAYKELHQRIERERHLGILQEKMEAKKHMNNKRKEKPIVVIKEETKDSAPILKWSNERKR